MISIVRAHMLTLRSTLVSGSSWYLMILLVLLSRLSIISSFVKVDHDIILWILAMVMRLTLVVKVIYACLVSIQF